MSVGGIAAAVVGTVVSGVIANEMAPDPEDSLTPDQREASSELLGGIRQYRSEVLNNSTNQFGKPQAIADAQGLVGSIFRQYQNTALPEIHQMEAGSGGYNSSTGQLLANDAFASANAKATEAVLNNIRAYRTMQQQDFLTLAQMVNGVAGGRGSAQAPGNSEISGALGMATGDLVGSVVSNWNKKPATTSGGYYSGMSNADITADFAGYN